MLFIHGHELREGKWTYSFCGARRPKFGFDRDRVGLAWVDELRAVFGSGVYRVSHGVFGH